MLIIILAVIVPIIITVVVLKNVAGSGAFGMSKEKQAQAQNLVATGAKARAMILKVQPTGMIVNEINIRCLVDFQLTPLVGGAPFQGQKKMMINQTAMPRVGDVWPCWYNPANPAEF